MIYFLSLLSVLLIIIFVVLLISTIIGVPCLPTRQNKAVLMMDLAGIKEGTKVVDLGSGFGRLMFLAAGRGAEVVGYELNPFLVAWSRLVAVLKNQSSKVKIIRRSLYKADLSQADVVFAYLFNGPMAKLDNKLWSELKTGAKVVSCTFPIPNRVPAVKQDGVFVYVV